LETLKVGIKKMVNTIGRKYLKDFLLF